MNAQKLRILLLTLLMIFLYCRKKIDDVWVASAPAGTAITVIHIDSVSVIPNGRLLSPLGQQIEVAPHPYGLTLSPDGSIAVTANSSVRPFSISIIRDILTSNPQLQQIPPGQKPIKELWQQSLWGMAISPDNKYLYVAGGQEGKVFIFNLASGKKNGAIECNVLFNRKQYKDSYLGDLILNEDGNFLYAVD